MWQESHKNRGEGSRMTKSSNSAVNKNNMKKTAIIIGATGLVGSALLKQLLADDDFSKVKIFVRRSTDITHEKLEEFIIDFDRIEAYKEAVKGDVFFSCLGTTLSQAGSKEKQYRVDVSYQYKFAEMTAENSVPAYVLVSSASANKDSLFFYTKMKGELEEKIKSLPFEKIIIVQPSILAGDRKKSRAGEKISAKIINGLSIVLPFLKKYKSISGEQVAKAMRNFYKMPQKQKWVVKKLDELKVC